MELEQIILTENKVHPYLSFTKLAKEIIKKHKVEYTPESLRKIVSKTLVSKSKNTETEIDFETEFDIDIPDSWAVEREPYFIPKAYDRILIISDVHIPFHDINALKTALKYGYDNGMNCLLINGDFVDFHAISFHSRSTKHRDLQRELMIARKILENIRAKFPNLKIIYKAGNHEYRLERAKMDKYPELAEIEGLQIEQMLTLPQLQMDYVDAFTRIEAGKLNIIHGHEIRGGGINVARTHFTKSLDNTIFGHFHRTQEYIQKTIKDHVLGNWSVGCLSELKPDYLPINNWNHGFAFVETYDDGTFTVANKKIIAGYVK